MTRPKIKPTNDSQRIPDMMTRPARARSSRAYALARLARTALGLPSAQERRAEPEPADRSLTVREQSLFRATTRRALRAATVLGGFTLTAVALPFDIGMMLLVPERQLLLFAIVGIEALFILGVTVLALGHWRLPPLPLAFALAFSLTVEMSCLLAFVPELWTPSLMLLGLLPPAIALFAPWSAKVHAGWLLAGAPVVAVVTVASPRGAVQFDEWFGAGTVLAISALVSLAGSFGKARVRKRAFEHQMEARSAHLATVAREAELERLNGELALVTRKDPLTGLGNRRRLDEELAAASAPGDPLRQRLRDRAARRRWLQAVQRLTRTCRRRRCPPGRRGGPGGERARDRHRLPLRRRRVCRRHARAAPRGGRAGRRANAASSRGPPAALSDAERAPGPHDQRRHRPARTKRGSR